MHLTRTLSLLFVLTLSLTACGGGGGSGLDDFASDLPTDTPPSVVIHNTANSHAITLIYAYEAYTGELYTIPVHISPGRSTSISGLGVSQYDFYVYFNNGRRSDSATTYTNDPYNGSPITRRQPRVNPGETARVYFKW